MTRVFVRHPVSDFAMWKAVYDSFSQERSSMGVIDHGVYQSADDPNDVTVYHDFESLEAAHAFIASPRLREVLQSAGVAGHPAIWFTTPA